MYDYIIASDENAGKTEQDPDEEAADDAEEEEEECKCVAIYNSQYR